MVDWKSPAEIAFDSRVIAAFSLVLLGIAVWDVLSTLSFDWSIISGKRKWRWPMLAYFVTRICMLLHIIPQAINFNAIHEIDCQKIIYIAKAADVVGTCGVSVILSLRTIAVWHQAKKVSIGLFIMLCGQFALWCMTLNYSRSAWSAQRGGCQVLITAPRPLLIAVFSYTMVLDLVILTLCTYRLAGSSRHGGISTLLLRDGIGYFLAAFGANMVQTIFAALSLNPVMNIMCLSFALVASVIAATRVFAHVFIAHDGLASTGMTSSSGTGVSPTGRHGLARISGRSGQQHSNNNIALGELRSRQEPPTISVHRMVEVEDDTLKHPYAAQDVESYGVYSPSDEKRSHPEAY